MTSSKLYLYFIIYTHVIFPFFEILISNSYDSYDITIVNISLDNWFAVKGMLSLLSFFIICVRDYQDIRTITFKVAKVVSIFVNFIILIWMILGCIVLYENANSQLGNKAPNFMYISIIAGFVSLINIFFIPRDTIRSLGEPLLVL